MTLNAAVEDALAAIGDSWSADDHEDASLDFKQTPESGDRRAPEKFLKDLAEAAVCFANGGGGTLIIGVEDRAENRSTAIVGVNPTRWNLDDIVQNIYARTSPSINAQPLVVPVDNKLVYALGIPQGNDVYSTTEGVYKVRVGKSCLALEGQQLRGLRTLRQGLDWSSESSGVDWSDLSRAALERGAELLSLAGSDELAGLALTDTQAFARATNLEAADKRPNRAAVLLYGTSRALSKVAEWGVNVQTRSSPGNDPRVLVRRDDSSVPLVLLIDRLLQVLGALTRSQLIRAGAEQVELVDYPPDALREVLANAFAHRDWEAAGVVEVVHSPDELVVTSPGGLLPTLRVDRLLHDAAAPRNRALASHMARLRLAEMSGLGFDRIFRSVAMLGKEPPILEDGPRFRVAIVGGGGDEAFARFLRGPAMPQVLATDVDVLNVLTALRHSKTVSAAKLPNRLQRNAADCQRVLRRMQDAGIVAPTRSTSRRAQPNYELSQSTLAGLRLALTYRTNSVDADDEKLLRHLRRHQKITNEDVRSYLDCDIMTARNRLKRLRDRRLIDFAPDSPRRGAMVVYQATERVLGRGDDVASSRDGHVDDAMLF